MFGHLNNARYLEIFEWARWEMHEQQGINIYENARNWKVGPVVVHVDVDYMKEVRLGETVKVRSWIKRIGNKSVTLHQEMIKDDGTVAARAEFIWAIMDFEKRKAVEVPDRLRKLYEEWIPPEDFSNN